MTAWPLSDSDVSPLILENAVSSIFDDEDDYFDENHISKANNFGQETPVYDFEEVLNEGNSARHNCELFPQLRVPNAGRTTPYVINTVSSDCVPVIETGHVQNAAMLANSQNAQNLLVELGKKLLEAARNGQLSLVKQLVEKGAPMTADWLGNSPLHVSALNGHAECALDLMNAGCSREARTKVEKTALHLACSAGRSAVVQLLLDASADVHVVDMLNMTPLHWAVQSGCSTSVEMLLRHGANVNVENKFGKSPLEIASDENFTDIYEMLMSADSYRESEVATRTITTELTNEDKYEMTETITVPPSANQEVIVAPESNDARFSFHTSSLLSETLPTKKSLPKAVQKIQAVQIKNEPGVVPKIVTVKSGGCLKLAPSPASNPPTRLIRISPNQANNLNIADLQGQKVMFMSSTGSKVSPKNPIKVVRVGGPALAKTLSLPVTKKTVTMLPAVPEDGDTRKRKLAELQESMEKLRKEMKRQEEEAKQLELELKNKDGKP